MDLFLDKLPELEALFAKEAAFAARVSERPENWPQELTSELLKQLPYLSDYNVNVVLERIDPQRGFAFGWGDISNKTERPEEEHGEMGLPHIRIPIVIMERQVKPFLVYLDGELVMPLTEERLREVLFNPGSFDISAQPPRDPSLVESLMPPTRSGVGYGGEYKTASVMEKTAKLPRGAQGAVRRLVSQGKQLPAALARRTAAHNTGREAGVALGLAKKFKNNLMAGGAPTDASSFRKFDRNLGQYKKMRGSAAGGIRRGRDIKAGTHKDFETGLSSYNKEHTASEQDLLHAIAPTINEAEKVSFIAFLEKDATVRAGLRRSGVVEDIVEVFDLTKTASVEERLQYIAERIEPSVITIHKMPGGEFLIKHANSDAANPITLRGETVGEEEAGQMIGPENAQAMMPGQTATMVPEPIELEEPLEMKMQPVERFGQYNVIDTMGNQLSGWVFPYCLAWDGAFSKQPIALFTNGSSFAMQDSIVGDIVGKSTNLPSEEHPVGEGVFYTTQGGNAVCTMPITVRSTMAGPDGNPKITAMDAFGNHVQISIMEGISQPMRLSDIEYAFPKTWSFMRLNNQTQLQGGGQDMSGGMDDGMGGEEDMEADMGGQSDAPKPAKPKAKSSDKKPDKKKDEKGAKPKEEKPAVQVNVNGAVKKEKTSAVLWYNGGFNIDGGCGLHKLADDLRFDMSPVDAECMLGLLGVDGHVAKQKVAEARRKGSVKLAGLKTITLLSERMQEATKTASAVLKEMPNLRRNLIKEAAVLQDKATVNDLLALNFINPENLGTFINYVPELEESSSKLAEMLLFSYLGMNEIPEGAVARAMKNLEDVIVALKNLAETDSGTEEG